MRGVVRCAQFAAMFAGLGLLCLGLACLGALAVPVRALASDDRVPDQVTEYFERSLVPRLAELYAPGADGASGIDFDASTSVGSVVRVSTWAPGFVDGTRPAPAIELTNRWVAPVAIDGAVVGLATVWVNSRSGDIELAEFEGSADLASAIAALPADAVLVGHEATGSWFAVSDAEASDAIAAPIDAGTTGISAPVALESLAPALAPPTPLASGGAVTAAVPAIALLVALVGIAAVVLWPSRRHAARDDRDEVEL